MNVNELIERILDVSHDEVAPDTNLKAQSLRWLNSAYHEMLEEISPFLENALQTQETLILSSGSAIFPQTPHKVVRVVTVDTSRTLQAKNKADVLAEDSTLARQGSPNSFWVEGNVLYTHPVSSEQVKVLYLPQKADLAEDGAESTVLVPRAFHSALVWGALVWSATFERGFTSQGDLALFQSKWEEAKRSAKLALSAQPSTPLRTKPFELV